MDGLKKKLMKAKQKYKSNPKLQEKQGTITNELKETFPSHYISEKMGIITKQIIIQRQQNKSKAQTEDLFKEKELQLKQVIVELRKQFEKVYAEPLNRKSIKIMELQTAQREEKKKIIQNISINDSQQRKNPPSNEKSKQNLQKEKSQAQNKHSQQAYFEQKNIQNSQKDGNCQSITQSIQEPFISDVATTSYHSQESIWKKYVIDDVEWEEATNQMSFPNDPIKSNQIQIESAPIQHKQENKNHNYSVQLKKSSLKMPQPKSQQKKPTQSRKQQKKKPILVDLMTEEQMRFHYNFYNPVCFPEEQIDLLIQALDKIQYEQSCVDYLDKVYQEYCQKGGNLEKKQVQEKIVCDLMFVVKQENFKFYNRTEIP